MQKKWRVLSEIWSKLSRKIWVSWQCYGTFQSAWLEGSEPSPKATGRDFLSVVWTVWTLKLKEISAGTSRLKCHQSFYFCHSGPFASTIPGCCSRIITPRRLSTSYRLGSCLASSRRHKTQSLRCASRRIFLPLQGPYTSAVAAAPGRTDHPSSPRGAPVQCGNGGSWRQGRSSKS